MMGGVRLLLLLLLLMPLADPVVGALPVLVLAEGAAVACVSAAAAGLVGLPTAVPAALGTRSDGLNGLFTMLYKEP
jgi:hypothetical protein